LEIKGDEVLNPNIDLIQMLVKLIDVAIFKTYKSVEKPQANASNVRVLLEDVKWHERKLRPTFLTVNEEDAHKRSENNETNNLRRVPTVAVNKDSGKGSRLLTETSLLQTPTQVKA
jgi:hypothetical protein